VVSHLLTSVQTRGRRSWGRSAAGTHCRAPCAVQGWDVFWCLWA